jgi:hypothetical protein
MPTLSSSQVELISGGISFLLTLMVMSYLIGDNPAFRLAIHVFIGISAGYAAAVTWHQVLVNRLFTPLVNGSPSDRLMLVIPLVLGILLLLKLSPRTTRLGSPAMAYLVGVGAAVAIGGAVLGTIFPQSIISMQALDLSQAGEYWLERLMEGLIMLVGTISTLAYFHFGARATPAGNQRPRLVKLLSWIGQAFIAITFGVLFAGVFIASLTAFIGRIHAITTFLSALF